MAHVAALQTVVGLLSSERGVKVPTTHPRLWKSADIWRAEASESSLIIFNGQLLVICFRRAWNTPTPFGIDVISFQTKALIATWPLTIGLGCAIVVEGVIHLFGSTSWNPGNSVMHCTLDPVTFQPGTLTVARSYPSIDTAYNSSVCADATGFTLTVECAYGGDNFYHATSINGPWTPSGWGFNREPTFYAGCPTIRWRAADSKYYLFYLVNTAGYFTKVARSATLLPGSWQFGPTIISYDGPGAEGINASDFDFMCYEGRLHGLYFTGDQATWANMKECRFEGTEEEFLAMLF